MQSERAALSFPGKNVSFLYIVTAPKKVIEFFVISLLILALSSFANDTAEQEKVCGSGGGPQRQCNYTLIKDNIFILPYHLLKSVSASHK